MFLFYFPVTLLQFPAKTATVPYHPIPMLQSAPFVMGGQYSMSEVSS